MKKVKKTLETMVRWFPIGMKYIEGYLSLHLFHRELLHKDIWLINEKKGEARDNGFHLYRYIRTEHPEINAYFVITKDSQDRSKVAEFGNLIETDSKEHMLYYLAAKFSISSQMCGAYPYLMNPGFFKLTKIFRNPKQKCVFLQHGIIKDAIPISTLYYKTGIHDLFVTSTEKEQSFVTNEYGYPEGWVQKLGLCRFDALHEAKDRKEPFILVMPTWRSWLRSKNAAKKASEAEMEKFQNSEYYQVYASLLKNTQLQELLEQRNYKLIFYPHYGMQSYIDAFDKFNSERIMIANRKDYDVQDLLIRSSILITDYSSVFFDFSYMNKPMIYYQFDEEHFCEKHYQRGYFSCREHGFGPVVTDEDDLLQELTPMVISNGSIIDETYKMRRDNFFDLADNKNCKRNFEAILSLNEEKR